MSIVRVRLIEAANCNKSRLVKYTVDFSDKIKIFAKFEDLAEIKFSLDSIQNLKEELEDCMDFLTNESLEDPLNLIFIESSEGFYKRDQN
ncbi:hypothetical protein V6O07_00445 [Arthrospira platensis SPKY2]